VTLLAPPSLGISNQAVPVDFSVNIFTPIYNSALMQVAAALDPRVLELGLLVKRWAKDRGVCHAAKGHLPPYAWNLLAIFFLQCLGEEEGRNGMLPAFDKFDWSTSAVGTKLSRTPNKQKASWVVPEEFAGRSTPELFKEFFKFYRYTVNWTQEGVSLHRGFRGPIPKKLKPAVVAPTGMDQSNMYIPEASFGEPHVALSIEDPWEPTRNLASEMTHFGLCRMKEELCRACELCAAEASLSKLLDPWVPPNRPDEPAKPALSDKSGLNASSGDDGLSEGKKEERPWAKSGKNDKDKEVDVLGAALFAQLKARGDEQARKATEEILKELREVDSPGAREHKTQELVALLKNDDKLSEMLAKQPVL